MKTILKLIGIAKLINIFLAAPKELTTKQKMQKKNWPIAIRKATMLRWIRTVVLAKYKRISTSKGGRSSFIKTQAVYQSLAFSDL